MRVGFLGVLVDPWSFFRERMPDPSLGWPAAIVLVSSLVTSLGGVVFLALFGGSQGVELQPSFLVFAALGVVTGVITSYVSWLVYAGVYYLLASAFGGNASFRDVLGLIGWGYLPYVVMGVVLVPGGLVGAQWLGPATYFVVTLWSAYIWVAAVETAAGLDRWKAAVTVSVPVGVGFLLTVAGVAFTGGI